MDDRREEIDNIARTIAEKLGERGQTLCVVETSAGGRVYSALSAIPGSSVWLPGGIIAYANRIKREVLGIPEARLKEVGSVSEAGALDLAEAGKRLFSTDWAVAESGIAGPQTGRHSTKPVGLVYLAAVGPDGKILTAGIETGFSERADNQAEFARLALRLLARTLDYGGLRNLSKRG